MFAGDILLSRNVAKEIASSNQSPWGHLATVFDSADFVFANLEGAVLADSSSLVGAPPYFDIQSRDLALLKDAGFDAVSVENNHSNDFGQRSKNFTARSLVEKGIQPVSFANSPQFWQIDNTTIAIIAINLVPDKSGSYTNLPSAALIQKLRFARTMANCVIVSVHWGAELLEWPNAPQRQAADWLTLHGADIIIGHHPHVVQNVELINGKPVFFSLGNHLFDQKYLPTKRGLIADIRLRGGTIRCFGIQTVTADRSFFPQRSADTAYSEVHAQYKNAPFSIHGDPLIATTKGYDTVPAVSLSQSSNHTKLWNERPMAIVDIDKLYLTGDTVYLFMLQSHYSSLDRAVQLRPYVYSADKFGLNAKWRGSALAWPLIDAQVNPHSRGTICALHRGDSFIAPDPHTTKRRIVPYRWNGFGFNAIYDSVTCKQCEEIYQNYLEY